ncbi:PREDICTED: uncharacterized protein LOC109181149 [Ipomoea nil]|uniref:uncharacterized protein LOC109181149 n=1 Tax=Ipomoea nil TaxID=35883 RepID=UPI00090150D2|nr:PREDICTED: uncharacterized protein LOC109181149 [Ipomoea nil]
MEWPFVERMLLGLDFDVRWVKLIMLCVQTIRYRVLMDGKPSEVINPTRGLRQGDPLSPYLFIIYAEGLSLSLQDAQETMEINRCLEVYEQLSGQFVNFHKSCISFSRNTVVGVKEAIALALGVDQAEDFGKYLGFPFVIGKNRKLVFSYVEHKLR